MITWQQTAASVVKLKSKYIFRTLVPRALTATDIRYEFSFFLILKRAETIQHNGPQKQQYPDVRYLWQ